MIAKRAPLALAFLALLAFACLPAPAWAQRRGGGHGGGYRSGGNAVPRGGSPGHVPRGVAQARHPRAGTGTGYHYGRYGGRYGGGYAPYHRGYYGYYRPYYGYGSFYFGWPFYYSGWPYVSGAYYSPGYSVPPYSYGYNAGMVPPAGEVERYGESEPPEVDGSEPEYGTSRPPVIERNTGRVRLEVRPDDASIYVDDEFWGNAREWKLLTLRSGPHAIELVRPGFVTARREVEVIKGETSEVLVELERP